MGKVHSCILNGEERKDMKRRNESNLSEVCATGATIIGASGSVFFIFFHIF